MAVQNESVELQVVCECPDKNRVQIGAQYKGKVTVIGIDNDIQLERSAGSQVNIIVRGNKNSIKIDKANRMMGLNVEIGSHVAAHEANLIIGSEFSSEPGCRLLLHTSGNTCEIGSQCMFSRNVVIRCGESPHLIFDKKTGDYIDTSKGVLISGHVWVGEDCYITKNVSIAYNSIVAACSVVTKRFLEENIVIGGNPAVVVKTGIEWFRNSSFLKEDTIYERNFRSFSDRFKP